MKKLSDFSEKTSVYELLSHVSDLILSGTLMYFSQLRAYVEKLPAFDWRTSVLRRAFLLQKRLYWGFFKDLDPIAFPKVWETVVVPDRTYPFAGDLKRFMSLPNIYVCIADIHGYTRFCLESRRNMSKLDLLDQMIQLDIAKVCARNGVMSRRSQGDEILMLGASGEDILRTVLQVIEYFAQRKRFKDEDDPATHEDDVILPAFQISAGIAGGRAGTPLVITRDGDLSGDIVNSAARLQARANRISPTNNKILVTGGLAQELRPEGTKPGSPLLGTIDFFNSGTIEFKGTNLPVYDVVFIAQETARLKYRGVMEELYNSLEKRAWKSKIFEDAVQLSSRVTISLPASRSEEQRRLLPMIKSAANHFTADQYERAIGNLGAIIDELSMIPETDGLALEYLREVHRNYNNLTETFTAILDVEIEKVIDTLFSDQERKNFQILQKHHDMFVDILRQTRQKMRNRKAIWYRIIDQKGEELSTRIRSVK